MLEPQRLDRFDRPTAWRGGRGEYREPQRRGALPPHSYSLSLKEVKAVKAVEALRPSEFHTTAYLTRSGRSG
jgi:hypothetical protein